MQPFIRTSRPVPSLDLLKYLRKLNGPGRTHHDPAKGPTGDIARFRPLRTPASNSPLLLSLRFTSGNGLRGEALAVRCRRTARPEGVRPFTTTLRSVFFGPWTSKKRKSYEELHPSDLPISSFIDDTTYPLRVPKATHNLKLRCTEFDENGNVTLVNGEYKKTELIAKYSLLPRDLRKIDSSMLPHILIRPSAILLNLLHLRVLIKHNRVLVFDAYGSTDSYTQSVFMYDLEGKLRAAAAEANQANSLAYEFRALEAVLISVTGGLESEFEGVREPVVRVLRELEEDIDRDKLRYLLVYSKKLGTFEQRARLVRDALDELLDADDDLAAMYLTEKKQGKLRNENDHTEVEMLLESYHKVTDEIVQAAENLVSNIRNTEEIVKAILDANRNSLMVLDIKFTICTLGLAAGTFVAALYGMNLTNFLEESNLGFGGVSAICALFTGVGVMWGLKVLRRVQRVRMSGGAGMETFRALTQPVNCNPPGRLQRPTWLEEKMRRQDARARLRAGGTGATRVQRKTSSFFLGGNRSDAQKPRSDREGKPKGDEPTDDMTGSDSAMLAKS